ncbi:MAG: 30S ribosomal protein S20 [Verrucomicrobiae bacterium]|nr:30S ribosomal protein S20 [Verrucomicrobiae bacterium]MCP5539057.1 30S ribosomal protein S20 [Akkermansiaceae bacterium]MCP5551214.1 30S ribosomal protein S20 [Akkermansiaceae bacterium]
MANNASALKRIRKTQAQTQRNRAVKSRVKTHRKKVLAALAAGDKAGAEQAYREFASIADKAGRKNVIHKNAAARLKSAMASRLKASS